MGHKLEQKKTFRLRNCCWQMHNFSLMFKCILNGFILGLIN